MKKISFWCVFNLFLLISYLFAENTAPPLGERRDYSFMEKEPQFILFQEDTGNAPAFFYACSKRIEQMIFFNHDQKKIVILSANKKYQEIPLYLKFTVTFDNYDVETINLEKKSLSFPLISLPEGVYSLYIVYNDGNIFYSTIPRIEFVSGLFYSYTFLIFGGDTGLAAADDFFIDEMEERYGDNSGVFIHTITPDRVETVEKK